MGLDEALRVWRCYSPKTHRATTGLSNRARIGRGGRVRRTGWVALVLAFVACGDATGPGCTPEVMPIEVGAVEIHHFEGEYIDTLHIFISLCVTPGDSVRRLRP
jgi:hypothetical protein